MKKLFLVLIIAAVSSCNEPLRVTTKSDPHTATSGTLGSAKFSNELPPADTSHRATDTTLKRDH